MSYANIFTESNVDLLNDPAVKQLLDYIAELESEVAEQFRLNGMGAEREARLMAKVAELAVVQGGAA